MRWTRGWQMARTREGVRRFWRGAVTITISEAKATLMETIAKDHGISRDQIVQSALDRWLEAYQAGTVKVPVIDRQTGEGEQRRKGTYYFAGKDAK